MLLPVTLAIAAACALINVWLGARCVRQRLGAKIMIGDGGNAVMQARARAHANFAEYAPFALILIGVIELARGPSPWLWGLGAVFVVARIAHPLGMDRAAPNAFRAAGTMLTFTILAALAIWALAIAYQAQTGPAPGDPVAAVPISG